MARDLAYKIADTMDDNISYLQNGSADYNGTTEASPLEECGSPSTITFQYYTWGVAANLISCYGIVGNILSIIVLSHRQMRNSTSYYLISLAIYDMMVLLFMSLFLAIPTLYLEKDILEGYYFAYPYMHPFVYPVALIAQTGTVYTILAFTVERYIAVCRPLHAANTCTMARTKRVIFIIFIASIAYNLPRFFEYQTGQEWSEAKNRTVPTIEYTEIGKNKVFQEVYFIYMYLFIMFLLPFGLLTVLNILLIRAVNHAKATRDSITSSNSKETNLTVMLIVVINVFLGCQLPALVDNMMVAIFGVETLNCSVQWVQFTTISNLLVVINSAVNFILYCTVGKRFRKVFLRMFCFKRKEPQYKYTVHQSSVYLRNANRADGFVTNVYDVESSLL